MRIGWRVAALWEAVVEGQVAHGLSGGIGGTSLVGNGMFLKGVLREGTL